MADNKIQVVYLHELLSEFHKEQEVNSGIIPHSIHAIGFHNGLTMATSIALKLASDDAAAVVRCQRCRFWERHIKGNQNFGSCSVCGITKHENGFCDLGKEKEN